MFRMLVVLGTGAALLGQLAAAQTPPEPKTRPVPLKQQVREMARKGWKLTFNDEFDGSKLDTARWIDSYPGGVRTHSNGELQYYAPDGYEVGKGDLRLIGTKRVTGADKPYTAGMVASYGKFAQKYGWFEIRAKFPAGKGYWPAFWLLPDDRSWPPEIDVLEILGHEMNKVYLTNHWKTEGNGRKSHGDSWVGPDFSKDYHTFAVDWEPGLIVWYVDGVERFRSTEGVPDVPMYIIANLAVGGDWPGNPDATTPFPGVMSIDYIRVFQHK